MDKAAENLQKLYKDLGDTQSDVRNRNMYRMLLGMLHGKTLLDIGCGALHFLNLANKKGFEAEGLEPDKELVKLGESFYGKVGTIHQLEINQLHKLNKKFDSISMIDVLEHIEDDRAALREIKNHLSNTGRIIILVPAYQYLYSERDASIGHFRRYSGDHLRSVLEECGYEVEKLRYWNMLGYFTYVFFEKILKKRAPHGLRTKKSGGFSPVHWLIGIWVQYIENNINLGFGLSAIAVARPKK